jgi:hypothetical protein
VILAIIPAFSFGQDSLGAWKQEQLSEQFMQSLTKDQCMDKTVLTLKAGCTTEQCIKTMAGVSGDCITWAKGNVESLCATYDREYIGRYCASNELDARRCILLHTIKAVNCSPPAQRRKP